MHTTEYRALQPAFPAGTETLAGLAKKFSGLPVIVNGHLHEPKDARFILESGFADVVAIGTGALAQPDWPRRVREGLKVSGDPHPDTFRPLADIKDWELDL